jgi:nucleoredoxin
MLSLAAILAVSSMVLSAAEEGKVAATAPVVDLGFLGEHFPDGIKDADGADVPLASLKGKAIGIYFSAHWCPPCRAFTPKLVAYRDKHNEKFEVVFVSSDRSAKKQIGYMKEAKMKWPTVAWRSDAATALSKKYSVRGIPKLVILRPDGSVFDTNGRSFVTANGDVNEALKISAASGRSDAPAKPEGASATPKTAPKATVAAAKPVGQDAVLKDHFPDGIVDGEGNPVDMAALKGKVVGIYFSASWCGPCRVFTPKLVEHRNKYKDNFEVVFVSSDRDADAQKAYMKKANMPWPTMAFRSDAATALSKRYKVRGIPALVILGADGEIVSRDGRSLIETKPDMAKLQAGQYEMVTEEYKCGRCDKMHKRQKLVIK